MDEQPVESPEKIPHLKPASGMAVAAAKFSISDGAAASGWPAAKR